MAIRARDEAGNLTGHPAYLASLLTTDIPVCYEEASASTMPMKMATSIECWLIDQLLPYARNARTHSDEQVAADRGIDERIRFRQSNPRGPRPCHHRRSRSIAGCTQTRYSDAPNS